MVELQEVLVMRSDKARLGLALVSMLALFGCGELKTEDPFVVPLDPVGPGEEVVPNQYIFFYRDDITEVQRDITDRLLAAVGGVKFHDYLPFINGFAAEVPPAGIDQMRRYAALKNIHPNGVIRATGLQTCPSWGLDVIDQALSLQPNDVYSYSSTGHNVHVYVLDSGIDPNHEDFKDIQGNSRIGNGKCVTSTGCANELDTNDCNGHGTHLAGIVGGKQFGVAKNVTIHPVRVLSCASACDDPSGTDADYLEGMTFVRGQNQAGIVLLGFSRENSAWSNLYENLNTVPNPPDNLVIVAAAGNNGHDACKNMPGGVSSGAMTSKKIITVGAFAHLDVPPFGEVSSFSNDGKCVDIFAPGTNILAPLSANCGNKSADYHSGTSVAAAHVAGAAALLLEQGVPAPHVKQELLNRANSIQLENLENDSPPLVVHLSGLSEPTSSPISSASVDIDADGCNDGVSCSGGKCLMCGALPARCNGLSNGGGITCNQSGECAPCGNYGMACCAGNTPFCADGYSCSDAGICSCGGMSQVCCGGPGGGCEAPLECNNNGICETCGVENKTCCDGNCGSVELSCHENVCLKCGKEDDTCCGGTTCYGTDLVCSNSTCKACGGSGQPCCEKPSCSSGLECVSGTCQSVPPCGRSGQQCCPFPATPCEGEMACDYNAEATAGICTASCRVRCQNGKLGFASEERKFVTEFDCMQWAQKMCDSELWVSRVFFNHKPIDGLHNCGETGEACCLISECTNAWESCKPDPSFTSSELICTTGPAVNGACLNNGSPIGEFLSQSNCR
jgi:subtilisin family serine protease